METEKSDESNNEGFTFGEEKAKQEISHYGVRVLHIYETSDCFF